MRRAARVGKTAVRFTLKVKVVTMVLPGVADGAKVFVVMERGKRHKSWSKTLGYVSSTAAPERKMASIEKWAEEILEVPVTLYRGPKGKKSSFLEYFDLPSTVNFCACFLLRSPNLTCRVVRCLALVSGAYQAKPFKIKLMRDPTGPNAEYGQHIGDHAQLATFALDASKFCVFR